MRRESLSYDVLIVGGGPSGLSAAIKLKQLASEHNLDLSVCLVEKGSEIGSHIISGAILEPSTLTELLPDWKDRSAPLNTPVEDERFVFLTECNSLPIPRWLLPPQMHNQGNYIVSLGDLCRWLAEQAEQLGVEIYPGFAATELLFNDDGSIKGVATGDMGIDKRGERKSSYQPGVELDAKYTLFSEGCRGELSQRLIDFFKLDAECENQTYGLGIKELWSVDPQRHQRGLVMHTAGWPLDQQTYGGSFVYHLEDNQVAIGMVVGLDYTNPFLSPFEEFQRFKLHPTIRQVLEGGQRLSYGARTLNEGGLQSLPGLTFPGGALIGCSAGFLNAPKIKGTHTAMKSGITAAECLIDALIQNRSNDTLDNYLPKIRESWLHEELYRARNFRPAFSKWGLFGGALYAGLDLKLFRGKAPWTLKHKGRDRDQTRPAAQCTRIEYAKPDGKISFDRLSSVYLSNTNHEDDQPIHLCLKDRDIAIKHNLPIYDAPEQRYCPGGVYEIVEVNGATCLQINAQNCLHCKACDIKDPRKNIRWTAPEGFGGPHYPNM
jgi:electron-transferring-flavoprotein dehydrogenase